MGFFEGKQLMAREICDFAAPHWPAAKVQAVATFLGESLGFVGAYNDNIEDGNVASRDCGICEINVLAADIQRAELLMTTSKDPEVYEPIVRHSMKVARQLYDTPMERNGKQDKRRWQPWVAYTTGWAMFPEWYVWSHGVGPWAPTGRFLHKAIRGVANWHLLTVQDMDAAAALAEAQRLAKVFGVTKGTLAHNDRSGVYWIAPPKPTSDPADGVGPRPKENTGTWPL